MVLIDVHLLLPHQLLSINSTMATSSYHPVGSSSSSPAPPPPQLRSFETIRRSVKSLEAQLDGHLTRYSSVASQIARGFDSDPLTAYGGSNGKAREQDAGQEQWKTLETTIEKALAELQGSLSSLTAILDDPELPPSNLQLHAVQRHREVLYDFERDYRRSKDNVRHAIDRRELLGGMKGEAEAYKTTDEDALLAERGRLDNSHSMIDGTLE